MAYRAMDKRYLMSLSNGAELFGRRRASRSARFTTRIWVIKKRWPTTASTSGGISVWRATKRRWTRLYLV